MVSPLNRHSADKIARYAGYIYDGYDKAFFEEIQRITIHSNLSTPFDFTMTGAVQTSSVEEFSA